MPLIVVSGSQQGAGATTVAVGLAHRLAYMGREVRLARLAGDARAEADAGVFANLDFASGEAAPVAEAAVAGLVSGDRVVIVEAGPGADASGITTRLGGRALLVTEGGEAGSGVLVNHAKRAAAGALPEDRLLAAPTVAEIIGASGARVLARSATGDGAVLEHILIGAISHDSDVPYFARFPRKAVVTRAERVDIALSALRTETECLILTGGTDPSPYLLDRVAAERNTTLLVAPEGTVETVRDIEGTFGRGAFSGEAKIERAGALVAAALDDAAVAALLA